MRPNVAVETDTVPMNPDAACADVLPGLPATVFETATSNQRFELVEVALASDTAIMLLEAPVVGRVSWYQIHTAIGRDGLMRNHSLIAPGN